MLLIVFLRGIVVSIDMFISQYLLVVVLFVH